MVMEKGKTWQSVPIAGETQPEGCDWFTLGVLSATELGFLPGVPLAVIKDLSRPLT